MRVYPLIFFVIVISFFFFYGIWHRPTVIQMLTRHLITL